MKTTDMITATRVIDLFKQSMFGMIDEAIARAVAEDDNAAALSGIAVHESVKLLTDAAELQTFMIMSMENFAVEFSEKHGLNPDGTRKTED